MSIILLTHPRSGSTKIIKCLDRYFSCQFNVSNKGEFFYLKNPLNYGDLKNSFLGSTVETKSCVDGKIVSHKLFIEHENSIQHFLSNEYDKRKKYLFSMQDREIFIFKYFFCKDIFPNFYNLIETEIISLDNYKKIFLHRQNLMESILSYILKDQIIDKNLSTSLDFNQRNSMGHNYGYHPIVKSSKKIYISKLQFQLYAKIFINYFLYYKKNYLKNETLIYERIFDDDSFKIEYGNAIHDIKFDLDAEQQMQYSIPKKDFFSNYREFGNFLYSIVKQNKLSDFFDRNGILYA